MYKIMPLYNNSTQKVKSIRRRKDEYSVDYLIFNASELVAEESMVNRLDTHNNGIYSVNLLYHQAS